MSGLGDAMGMDARTVNRHLGRRLAELREARGWDRQRLGALVGVPGAEILAYECGDGELSARMLWRLALRLGAPVERFYDGLSRAS